MSPVRPKRATARAAKIAAIGTIAAGFVASIAGAASATNTVPTVPEPPLTTSSTSATETTSASTSSTETTSTSAAETSAPADNSVYADIYVELGTPGGGEYPDDHDPFVFEATHVLVGPGYELTRDDMTYAPAEYGADVNVDVSLDPLTVSINGGEYNDFGYAYLEVTLTGASFGTVTVTNDNLFSTTPRGVDGPPDGPVQPDNQASGLTGTAGSRLSRSVITALLPNVSLQSYGVSGSTFAATWLGTDWTAMSGSATFSFVRTANGPVVSDANPVFTG